MAITILRALFPSIREPQQGEPTQLLSSLKFLTQVLNDKTQVNKDEIIQSLREIFGDRPVDLVFSYSKVTFGYSLDRNQLLMVLAMIGHAVTLLDLQIFWEKIRNDKSSLAFLQFPSIEGAASQVNEVPANVFDRLLQVFRNYPHFLHPNGNSHMHIWDELSSIYADVPFKDYMAYTRFEGELTHIMGNSRSDGLETSFNVAEQLAKAVAFAEPESIGFGMIVKGYEKDGTYKFYRLHYNINRNGLHCYFFTPLDDKGQVIVVFRGTKPGDDIASVQRDLDYRGVGKAEFESCAEELESMIFQYFLCYKNAGDIVLLGHSLGGADAQRLAARIVRKDVSQKKSKIRHLSLFAFNSPKIDLETVNGWEADMRQMAQKPQPCQIELNFAQSESDVVTMTGDKNLSCPCSYDFMKVRYLIASRGPSWMDAIRSHSMPIFVGGCLSAERTARLFSSTGESLGEPTVLPERDGTLSQPEESNTQVGEEAESAVRSAALRTSQEHIHRNQTGLAQLSWFCYIFSYVLLLFKTIFYFALFFFLPTEDRETGTFEYNR